MAKRTCIYCGTEFETSDEHRDYCDACVDIFEIETNPVKEVEDEIDEIEKEIDRELDF